MRRRNKTQSATGPTTVFRTEWFSVEEESFDRLPGLKGKPYYRIRAADGVLVFATTARGKIILIKQYRPVLGWTTVEIPCGHIDKAESPRRAAARELYEETGYRCRHLTYLGAGRLKMDRLACREHAFLGSGAVRDPKFKSKEDIEVILVDPAELHSLVRRGKFQQWSALALLLLADWKLAHRVGPSRKKDIHHE